MDEEQGSVAFRDIAGPTKWLKIALSVLVVATVASAWSSWLQILLIDHVLHGGVITDEAATMNDARERLLGLIDLAVYVATAIFFLRWIYLAKKNAIALGARNLAFSPGWSVGHYFVPFANLWYPYKALKETFQASHPEFHENLEWISPPRLLALWWTLWLASCFWGQWMIRYAASAKTVSELLYVSWSQLLSLLIELCLVAVVWVLISTLQRWQTERRSLVEAGAGAETAFATQIIDQQGLVI